MRFIGRYRISEPTGNVEFHALMWEDKLIRDMVRDTDPDLTLEIWLPREPEPMGDWKNEVKELISNRLLEEMDTITRMSVESRKGKEANDEYILDALEAHVEEVRELFYDDNSHYVDETADIIILALEFMLNNHINPDDFIRRRLERVKERIAEDD